MAASQELTEVRQAHRFDERGLERYLSQHITGFTGPMTVRQFEGGQSNPTFLLDAGDARYVLRKKPPGPLLPTAHMVDREFRVIGALYGTGVPVPRTYVLCEDESIIGTAFFVMEFVQGRIFWDPTLPTSSASERTAIYSEMNRVLTALHGVDYRERGLGDFGKPGNYFERQIKRWTTQYLGAKTEENVSMDKLMAWLPENVPKDDVTCIVHGDYRLDNMVFHPTEARVIAVLDWELSTLGHPLGDLAYNCLPYHMPREGFPKLAEVAGASSGIPLESEYVEQYCRRTGRSGIANWNFYLAFSLFRLASITQGVYKRALLGNASSERAHRYIGTARMAGETAWKIAEGER